MTPWLFARAAEGANLEVLRTKCAFQPRAVPTFSLSHRAETKISTLACYAAPGQQSLRKTTNHRNALRFLSLQPTRPHHVLQQAR